MVDRMDDPLNTGRVPEHHDDHQKVHQRDPTDYREQKSGYREQGNAASRYGRAARPKDERADDIFLRAPYGGDPYATTSLPLNPSKNANSQEPLTHRPRDLAQLTQAAIQSATGQNTDTSARDPAEPSKTTHDTTDRSSKTVPDLQPLADQLISIAQKLCEGDFQHAPSPLGPRLVSPEIKSGRSKSSTPVTGSSPQASPASAGVSSDIATLTSDQQREAFAEMARVSYAKRRKRTTIFGDPELFGEPAWDILLDLYIAQVEAKSVSVSSACIGSASPPTTGLRWLGVLADQGLVEREHDPQDQRRVLVRLSEKALDAMDEYFAHSAGLRTDRRAAPR